MINMIALLAFWCDDHYQLPNKRAMCIQEVSECAQVKRKLGMGQDKIIDTCKFEVAVKIRRRPR